MSNKVRHGKRYFKQMTLEVAVRNPERHKSILQVIVKYEGKLLNDSLILEIYSDLFISKVIESICVNVEDMTIDELKDFILNNLSHQNEWGFPTGYQAAFCRYLKTLSEFGFIYTQYNETIKISEVAKAWLNDTIEDSEVFALQCMRFWRKSPYRRVLNDYNYFQFILKVLKKLEQDGKSLSYPQFILSLMSDNDNVDDFIDLIKTNKIGNDVDKTYKYIVYHYSKVDSEHGKVAKQSSVCNDYANTVFRVLQLTGLISVDSKSGIIMISINKYKEVLLNKLLSLNFSVSTEAKENEEKYYNELGYFDEKLKNIIVSCRENEKESVENYNSVLESIIKEYDLNFEKIQGWIKLLSNNKKEQSPFWYIQAPLKMEFFISLLTYINYGKEMSIHPNYKTDTNGIPYQHAPGNIGDIEVTSKSIFWLIEVTLIRNKIQQYNMETTGCVRHFEQNDYLENYLSLVAPYIHPDTMNYYDNEIINFIRKKQKNKYLQTFNTSDFIDNIKNHNILAIMKSYKENIYNELKSSLE